MPPKKSKKTGRKKPIFEVSKQVQNEVMVMENQTVQYATEWDENRDNAIPPNKWPPRRNRLVFGNKPKEPLKFVAQEPSQETIDAKRLNVVHDWIKGTLSDITGGKDVSPTINELFSKLNSDEILDIYIFLEYCKNTQYKGVGRNNPDTYLTADDIIRVRNTFTIPDDFVNSTVKTVNDIVLGLLNTSKSKRTSPRNMYVTTPLDYEVVIDFGLQDMPTPQEEVFDIPDIPTPSKHTAFVHGPSMNYINVISHLNNLLNPPREFTDLSSQRERIVASLKETRPTKQKTGPNNPLVVNYTNPDTRGFAPKCNDIPPHTSVRVNNEGDYELVQAYNADTYTNSF